MRNAFIGCGIGILAVLMLYTLWAIICIPRSIDGLSDEVKKLRISVEGLKET